MPQKKQLDELAKTIADHQANLTRLSEAWGQKIVDHLDDVDRKTIAQLKTLLEEVKANYKVNTARSLTQLEYIRKKIEKIRTKAFVAAEKELRKEAPDLIDNETKWSKKLLSELTGEKASAFADLTDGQAQKILKSSVLIDKPWDQWWTNTAYGDVMRIANVVNAGVVQGLTIDEMVQQIMGTKARNYTDGVLSTNRAHARNLARTLCGGISNQAKDQFYRDNDDVVIGVEWLDTLDGRTCVSCASLSRKRWKPHDPHPVPPRHPSCYDSETRVMTDQGLKYFRDLDGSELFFSFNPETEQLEFVPAVKHIRYSVDEKLIHFKNDRFDLLVTKNHQMFGYRKAKGCIEGYKFYDAENVPKWGYRIPCGAKWEGRKAMLTPQRIAWLRFMAFWLADGSVTKRSENHYQIKIAQYNNGWMREELKDFPFALGHQESCLMFSDSRIGRYLMRFGHAAEKYIPADIKNSSPEEIRVFLDAFAKTDGSIRKGKFWKGYQFEDSVMYFTSSERMRDDLCELILKSGGRPSVITKKTKDKVQKFRNGEYTINSDGYVIHHLRKTGAFTKSMTKTEVDYCGEVFCVELERNHTLYVERNGKFCWCGNCRCVLIPVTELDDMGEDMPRPAANADFMALAKEEYEQKYPGKKWEDLAYSTRKQKYYKAMKDFEKRTGKPAYRQVPGSMNFKEYFETMTEDQKRDWLGPGKYAEWKAGKPIEAFIPPYPDKAYTVKELKAMDKDSFKK